MKTNPIKQKTNLNNPIISVLPQGWAFFTRNPREAQIIIYKKENQQYTFFNTRNSNPNFFFGINRSSNKILGELQLAKTKINSQLYLDTVFNYQNTVSIPNVSKLMSYNLKNELTEPTLCGEYIVVYQEQIPWAWSNNISVNMPAKMIKINFICDDRVRK